MGDVDIEDFTSVISAAAGLITDGTSLDTDMSGLIDEISSHEGAHVWGSDDFATQFLNNGKGGYHHPIANGKGTTPAAETVKGLGKGQGKDQPSLGTVAQDHGNYAANAMLNLSGTDQDNGADIGSVDGATAAIHTTMTATPT
jgi:hypothetical protein